MSRCATDASVAVIRTTQRSVGLMDKASAPGAGDSRFESWADQLAVQLPAPGQHLGTRCSTHNARPRVKRAAHEGALHRPNLPWPCFPARRGGLPSMSRCATDASVAVIRTTQRSVGLMDKASAPGAGDSRFESWADQLAAWLPGPGQHLGNRCSTHSARPSVKRAAHEAHRTDPIFPRLASVLEAVTCPPCLAAPPMLASQ